MRDHESTLVGDRTTFVVVDDPDGHVVPSRGVHIVGRMPSSAMLSRLINAPSQGKSLEIMSSHYVERKQAFDDYPGPIHDRKKARKSKQRLKGLRP